MSMATGRESPGGREGDSPLQGDALAALTDPNAYCEDPPTKSVEWIQTHLSHVFLTDSRVYKFRKPVDLGFAQLSTRAQKSLLRPVLCSVRALAFGEHADGGQCVLLMEACDSGRHTIQVGWRVTFER